MGSPEDENSLEKMMPESPSTKESLSSAVLGAVVVMEEDERWDTGRH
jgi:hypothetical protein